MCYCLKRLFFRVLLLISMSDMKVEKEKFDLFIKERQRSALKSHLKKMISPSSVVSDLDLETVCLVWLDASAKTSLSKISQHKSNFNRSLLISKYFKMFKIANNTSDKIDKYSPSMSTVKINN